MKTNSRDVVRKEGVRNKGGVKKSVPLFKQVLINAGYAVIVETLSETGFNKSKAAEKLGIDRGTLTSKIKEYNRLNKR
jgi:DNA-binding NtrC family response regulator